MNELAQIRKNFLIGQGSGAIIEKSDKLSVFERRKHQNNGY
jgi:hypothetical protein